MRDFSLKIYSQLIENLIDSGYDLKRFDHFISESVHGQCFILRHDVDRKPENSLRIAQIQNELGVCGTYYFRIVPESFQPKYIEAIAALGHEIGYHYEDLTICRGNFDQAIEHFEQSLSQIRKYASVNTICMHGSPMTKWDNRDIWKKYNYRDFGIKAEPYFDVDFTKVYYLTDTGRRWDGHKVSVRDKVNQSFDFSVSTTQELIDAIQERRAPHQIMQNIHPERWTDNQIEWIWEYAKSTIKNPIKRFVGSLRAEL